MSADRYSGDSRKITSYFKQEDRSEPKLFLNSLVSPQPPLLYDVAGTGVASPSDCVHDFQTPIASAKMNDSGGAYFTPSAQPKTNLHPKTRVGIQSSSHPNQEVSISPVEAQATETAKCDTVTQKSIPRDNRPLSSTHNLFSDLAKGSHQKPSGMTASSAGDGPRTSTPNSLQILVETQADGKEVSSIDCSQKNGKAKFECYNRKLFMQVGESRDPDQWVDYGKCNGLTDDLLHQCVLKDLNGLTVKQYDGEVKMILSRMEGTIQPAYNCPSRENASTVYPDVDATGDVGQSIAPGSSIAIGEDSTTMQLSQEKSQINSATFDAGKSSEIEKTNVNPTVSSIASGFGSRSRMNVPSPNTPFAVPRNQNPPNFQKSVPIVQNFFEEQPSFTTVVANSPLASAGNNFKKAGTNTPLQPSTLAGTVRSVYVPPSDRCDSTARVTGTSSKPLENENTDKGFRVIETKQELDASFTTAVDEKDPNALFFQLMMAEFASLDAAKQKAFKKSVTNLLYEC